MRPPAPPTPPAASIRSRRASAADSSSADFTARSRAVRIRASFSPHSSERRRSAASSARTVASPSVRRAISCCACSPSGSACPWSATARPYRSASPVPWRSRPEEPRRDRGRTPPRPRGPAALTRPSSPCSARRVLGRVGLRRVAAGRCAASPAPRGVGPTSSSAESSTPPPPRRLPPRSRPRSPRRSPRPPHPVSMAALSAGEHRGDRLRLGAVRERTAAYTSYDVTYRATTTDDRGTRRFTISGVLNVPTGRGPVPSRRPGPRLHRPRLLRPRPGDDPRARGPRQSRVRRAARRLPRARRVDRRPALGPRPATGLLRRRDRGRQGPARRPRRARRRRPGGADGPLDGRRRGDEGPRRGARARAGGIAVGLGLLPGGGELQPVHPARRRRARGGHRCRPTGCPSSDPTSGGPPPRGPTSTRSPSRCSSCTAASTTPVPRPGPARRSRPCSGPGSTAPLAWYDDGHAFGPAFFAGMDRTIRYFDQQLDVRRG